MRHPQPARALKRQNFRETPRPARKTPGSRAAPGLQTLLRRPTVQASVWSFIGHGASLALKFAGNLILTRLLFPEAFGLMTLMSTLMTGLALISDTGLVPAIIQNPRGEAPEFLRTAWVIQALRGVILSLVTAALAWPAAEFYGQPQLLYLLPVAGLSFTLTGLQSTALFLRKRRLDLGRVVAYELLGQGLALSCTLLLAWQWRSVWALVGGMLFGAAGSTLLSHLLMGPPRMGFHFDKAIAAEMYRFGRWLFLATLLTFLGDNLDRLILGKLMPPSELALYSIALMFATLVPQFADMIGDKVLLPAYSGYFRQGREAFAARVRRVRLWMLLIFLPPMAVLSLLAPEFIHLVYDARYHGADWMLQILACGAAFAVINAGLGPVLIAAGNTRRHMWLMAGNTAILLAGLGLGGWLYGPQGLILGKALALGLFYLPLMAMVWRYGVLHPVLDGLALLAVLGISAVNVIRVTGWRPEGLF